MPPIDPNSPVPLYHQVYKSLVERIQIGEFKPGSLLPGWRQLAEEYEVSSITIIKSLEILQQQGFVEKKRGKGTTVLTPFASNGVSKLSTQRKTIVFYSGVGTHPFLLDVLMGITSVTSEQGFNLQIIGTDDDPTEERHEILNVIDNGCAGLIAYPIQGEENIDLFSSLVEQKFPLVMVDRYLPHLQADCVLNDDENGGYELTKALIAQGHKRIAVVQHYEADTTSVTDRIKGYRRALKENGIPLDKNLIWLDIYPKPQFVQDYKVTVSARNLLHKRIEQYEPTALLAINQDTAQRVANDLHALQSEYFEGTSQKKIGIQNVSSIAAFSFQDNLIMDPFDLTLAYQSGKTLGSEAAKMLIDRINNQEWRENTVVRVPVTIIPMKGDELVKL